MPVFSAHTGSRLTIIFFTILFCSCVYRQDLYKTPDNDHDKNPVFFSANIDGIFNADECKKYGFFQNFVKLDFAVFFPARHGGYIAEIRTPFGRYSVCVRDPKGLEILRAYVNNYESIRYAARVFMADWGIVEFDVHGLPISKCELEFLGCDNSQFKKGCIYGCAGSFLVGALPGLLVLISPPQYEDDDWPPPSERGMEYITCLFIPPILAIPGCLLGGPMYSSWYRNHTVEYIKQSRQLKKLD